MSPLPPWTAYLITVDGQEKVSERASWRSVDRWDMDTLGKPAHRLGLTVQGGNFWPLSPIRLVLEAFG